MRNDFCPVKERKADDTECGSIIFNATDAVLAVCQTCARGKALAGTVSSSRAVEPAAHHASAPPVSTRQEGPAKTAWQLVVEATGHTSQGRLADALGTNQTKISQMFQKLGKGRLPSGQAWDDMLQLSGLSAETLFFAATGKPLSKAQPAERPSASAPVTSSPPKPSGPVPCAGPDSTIEHDLGTESAEQLLDSEESPSPEIMSLRGVRLAFGSETDDVRRTDISSISQEALNAGQLQADPQALPADLVFFDDEVSANSAEHTLLRFDKNGDITISPAAVAAFGLDKAERVRIGWSAATRQFCLQPGYDGPGSRKIQVSKRGCGGRAVNTRLAVRALGVNPAPGAYPLTLGPSGLIVATISQQPSQGGEA